jgi:hypothetical protein
MINQYKEFLELFFEKLLYYRHLSNRLDKVLKEDISKYTSEGAQIHLASALIISDWTGPTDNGYELNFHSGVNYETTKNNYEIELNRIFTKQLCLLYAQSFESFERFLKDCLFDKQTRDNNLNEFIDNQVSEKLSRPITRAKMPGGDTLFKILKKAGGLTFTEFSKSNNVNIRFNELWTILSETRHAITHNDSQINLSILKKSDHHWAIFEFLFAYQDNSEDSVLIELDYKKFDRLNKRFAEFAYQIFKILSTEEGLIINNE